MTEGMFISAVNEEDKLVSLGQYGYMIDYQYQSANVYIDDDRLVAIAEVKYLVTSLAKQNNPAAGAITSDVDETLRITYIQADNGEFLIDDIKTVYLVDNQNIDKLQKVSEHGNDEKGHD